MNIVEQNILNLEIGEVYELGDIWDGNGDVPTESYSYCLEQDLKHADFGLELEQWVDYQFEFVNIEDKEKIENGMIKRRDALDVPVKLMAIEIL